MTRTRRARSSMLRLECLEDRSVPATFHVTTILDVVDPADGKLSLREAITAANDSDEVDVIVVPAGSYKIALTGAAEDGNATGDFDVTDAVTIRGAGAGSTIINGAQLDRVFNVLNGDPDPIKVVFRGMTIRNGNSTNQGGGILAGHADLVVRDCVISRNVARFDGGGIYADRVKLANTTISRNYAEFSGGGIYADQLTATHSTFSGNYAGSRGGGIYGGTVVLNFCTVTGNIAENGFPGIAPFRSLTLNSCTVSGNTRSVPPTLIVTTALDVVDRADGKLSLREAITAANASVFPDTIVLPAGVFRIGRSGAGEDGNATGDFDIASRMTIRGAGAGSTIINGGQLDRVFDIHGNSSNSNRVTVEKLQVRNGNAIGHGGGIRVADTFLTVRDAIIAGNQASGNGGGVSDTVVSASVTLVRTTIARNAAGANGGGINSNSVGLTNSTVSNNSAAVSGGGVYVNFGSVTRSTISNNSAAVSGGGVYATFSIYLTSSTASGNEAASGNGGGVFADDFASLTDSTVSGNAAAASGGGVYATLAYLTNSTVSSNSAAVSGGGVYADGGSWLNGTIVGNSAQTGGGVFRNAGVFTFTIQSTIIALNLTGTGGSGPDVSGGAFTSAGHNLIGINGSTGFTNGVNGDIVGTSGAPIDPMIGDLKKNGGRTATHALLAGSPAIDAGSTEEWVTTDQRGPGFPRVKDGNGDGVAVVDIGAFER